MKLTEFIGIVTRNMHVKLRVVWRSFNFWQKNADSARTLEIGWNFDISQSSPKFMKLTEFIGITSRNMYVKFEAVWRSFNFWQKVANSADLRKMPSAGRMKFWHFLKVLRNSWNLQNLLESPPGTCMWNLKQFGEVSIFDRKMPTAPADLRKRRRTLMKFWHFLKVPQNSWQLTEFIGIVTRNMHVKFEEKLTEFIGITSRNMEQFGEVSIFDRKMPTP